MTTVKPVQTRYRGYRFRSRLEARWAVFFDTLGIEWQYEPEGFELPSGRYLPDFRLVGAASLGLHDQWVEVKGDLTHVDLLRLLRAAPELPCDPMRPVRPGVLLLGDVPEPGDPIVHNRLSAFGDMPATQNVFFDRKVIRGARSPYFVVPIGDSVGLPLDGIERLTEDDTATMRADASKPLCEFRLTVDDRVSEAYGAARSARFEHGESGASA